MIASPGTAVITGASSGLGAEYARQLAARGYGLLLVARRADRLEALAADLRTQHGIAAAGHPADLNQPAEVEALAERLRALPDLSLLINNAGFGTVGAFTQVPLEKSLAMVQVHLHATLALTHAALPGLTARGRGALINVASLAGFVPRAGSANYGATKAYLIAFSEALQLELASAGVRVQALCPGFTYTEFHDTPEFTGFSRAEIPGFFWTPAAVVVRASLAALATDRVVVVPTWRDQLLLTLTRSRVVLALLLTWRRLRRRRLNAAPPPA